jgi:fructuronate reductase
MVHLGAGNFHRAHQGWYTANTPGAGEWGYAAFTGRSARMAEALAPQNGLYTLITRSAERQRLDRRRNSSGQRDRVPMT